MASAQAIVELGPSAVELVDRTIIERRAPDPGLRAADDRYVRGSPDALLLVEFAGDELASLLARLERLEELMAELGLPGRAWSGDRAGRAGRGCGTCAPPGSTSSCR